MSEHIIITEEVIEYPKSLLDAWKNGDKSLVPYGFIDTERAWRHIRNQPSNHFGEIYTLRKKMEQDWKGFNFYLISDTVEPTNEKYFTGKQKVIEILDSKKLCLLRQVAADKGYGNDRGLPDLFLYNEQGDVQFLEVKKESDRIQKRQLVFLAMIKGILGCDVGVVYLKEIGKSYIPKVYELDLKNYTGKRLS